MLKTPQTEVGGSALKGPKRRSPSGSEKVQEDVGGSTVLQAGQYLILPLRTRKKARQAQESLWYTGCGPDTTTCRASIQAQK